MESAHTDLPNLIPLDLDKLTTCTEKSDNTIRFVFISDTHTETDNLILPEGDVLLHAGDFTYLGLTNEILHFQNFLQKQPHKYKIVVAGNHDLSFDAAMTAWRTEKKDILVENFQKSVDGLIYLEDSFVDVFGYKIYGSPFSALYGDWAFMGSESKLEQIWKQIPDNVDILITHGPPRYIGDLISAGINSGSLSLLKEVQNRIKPRYHLFGHVHEAYGAFSDGTTIYINGAVVNFIQKKLNKPFIIDLPKKNE